MVVGVGDRLEHSGIRHRRVHRPIDEVEFDLHAEQRLGWIALIGEEPVRQHSGDSLGASPDLFAEQSAVLAAELLGVHIRAH